MKNSKETGITLIALIITIIVMLILAGVSLNLVLGENGILEQSTESAEKTDIAETKEKIEYALVGRYDTAGKYTIQDVLNSAKEVTGNEVDLENQTVLSEIGNTVDISDLLDSALFSYGITENLTNVVSSESNVTEITGQGAKNSITLTYTAKSKAYTLPNDITVTGAESYTWNDGTLILSNISSDVTITITADQYYGAVVKNYKVDPNAVNANGDNLQECLDEEGVEWLIFYDGTMGDSSEEYIYLIASQAILATDAPEKEGASIVYDSTNYPYAVTFENVRSYYTGGADITDDNLNNLNSLFFAKYDNSYDSSKYNIKDVAYMMDTDIWNAFAGDGALYAIASPSVELFVSSYNEFYDTDIYLTVGGYLSLKKYYGYFINSDVTWSVANTYVSISEGKDNRLYSLGSDSTLMLSSCCAGSGPSSGNNAYSSICYSNSNWLNSFCYHTVASGYSTPADSSWVVRPIVCLSQNTTLEKQSDGTYLIK